MSRAPRWLLVGAVVIGVAGCTAQSKVPSSSGFSTEPSVTESAPASGDAPPATWAESSSSASSAPSSSSASTSAPAETLTPPGGQDNCGAVTTAAGMSLEVTVDGGAVDCQQAKQVVTKFHAKIAPKQRSDSGKPAAATVDGWKCVAGPAAAQGGTTCSKGGANILGAVVEAE